MTTAAPTDLSFRAKIFDVREQRRMAAPLRYEYRTDGERPQVILEGYAATFAQPYEVYGGPKSGGWDEQIHNRAFDRTLSISPDVQLLLNHEGLPLARTKSGTMQLSADEHGLLVRATLDPTDPDVQRLMPKMRRGDMDEMSFAFRVAPGGQEWDDSFTKRTITEINLQKGDVSVVNYGANPNTAAMLSTEAVSALAQLSNSDLVEIRKMDRKQVRKAMEVLSAATATVGTRASTPKKYAGVDNFADPGYLDSSGKPAKGSNGKKRYPLNSAARVRNALARFAQNKGNYTAAQQSAIMGKIRAAAKKFGIEVGDSKAASTLTNVDHIDLRPSAAGGTHMVAVLHDGSEVMLPATQRGSAFAGAPYVWRPTDWPQDPHDEKYEKEQHAMDDDDMDDRGHDADCDGEHDDDEPCNDEERDGNFGGKQAKPFGSDDDDEKKGLPDADAALGTYSGTSAQGAIATSESENADEHEQQLDLGLAAALEATIVTCYNMAEGDKDLRNMLAKARRQIRDLQGTAPSDTDVARKLEELRAEFGEPKTIKVSEGLAAIRQAGFANTMQPKAS